MSRFPTKTPGSIAAVIAAEGKEYEVTFDVPTPIGKFYGDIAVELLRVVTDFRSRTQPNGSEIMNDTEQADLVIDAFTVLRKNKRFWDPLLPAALGLKDQVDEKEGMKYLREFLTNRELIELFVEAAEHIISYSFTGDETEEALAKSEGGAVVVEEESTVP